MASGRTLRAIVGAAAALLVVAGLYLIARPEDAGDAPSAPPVARATDPAPAPAELPAAPVGSARPIDAGDASNGGEPGPTSGAVPLAAAPVALADIGQPVTLSGRVVDERGAAVAGAEVIHVASPAVVKALGRKPIPFGPHLPWDDFVRTLSDEQGRFALHTHELPRPEREVRPPIQDGAYVSQDDPVPRLVVLHPVFEAALHVCRGYRAGDYDAGEIALRPGCTLVGRLVDARGAAVAGGAVSASELGDLDDARWDEWNVVSEALATRSGEDGRFALGSLWPGDVQCTIEAAGFVPLDKRFPLLAGPANVGDIVLDRGGTIAGRVLDAQGAPVAGAVVKGRASQVDLAQGATETAAWELEIIARGDNARDSEAVSGAAGEFELLALNQEKYTLLAGLAGYEPAKLSDVAVGTSDATLTLRPSATVVVSVLDARTREPVAGASATGRRMSGESNRSGIDHSTKLQILTGDDALAAAAVGAAEGEAPRSAAGLIVATGLGSVRNTLTMSAPGYATLELELPAVAPSGRALQVVELPREASIAGRVVDARGAGIPGAAIEVVESQPVTPARAWDKPRTETADAEGRFRIGALRAGEWKLTASADGFARADAVAVAVAAEQALDDVTLKLAAAARITGVLLASSGAPLPGGQVQARRTSVPASGPIVEVTAHGTSSRRDPSAPGRDYVASSDERGRFAIDGLPAGSYEVTAGPGAQSSVELAAGGVVELELRQRQSPTIRGRVTDADGPVAGASVTCHLRTDVDTWNENGRATTNPDGEYQIQLAQIGECVLVAEQGDERAPPRRATATWDTPVLLDLAFGGESLRGRVLDAATSAPLDGATIRFSNPAQCERDGLSPRLAHFYSSSTRSGDQGRFETRRVEPGRYTLEVSKKGYAAETREGVEVPRPAGAPELSFELVPGAIVNGTVRAAGGGVLEGEWMVQLRVDPRADGGPPYDRRMTLPPDRRFERRDLPAGRCLVKALRFAKGTADGSDPWTVVAEQGCELVSGETTTVDLVIAP
jgi:hypothetical protein